MTQPISVEDKAAFRVAMMLLGFSVELSNSDGLPGKWHNHIYSVWLHFDHITIRHRATDKWQYPRTTLRALHLLEDT